MAVRITLANSHDDFAHVETSEGTVEATRRCSRSWRSRFGFTAAWLADVEIPGRHFEPVRQAAFIRSDRPLDEKLDAIAPRA